MPEKRRRADDGKAADRALFDRMKTGDAAAREALVRQYAPLVEAVARRYRARFPGIDLAELVAEGNHGLLEALDRFDPSKSVKFSTYAWFWIVKNVQEYISSSIALIGMPARLMADLRRIVQCMNEEIKKGREPAIGGIARKLGLDPSAVSGLLADRANLSNPLSLDKYLDDEDRDLTLGDVVEDRSIGPLQDVIDRMDEGEGLSSLLEKLSPLEREVIRLRFGVPGGTTAPRKDVAEKLNLSTAKVKDVETMAVIKLRKFAREG